MKHTFCIAIRSISLFVLFGQSVVYADQTPAVQTAQTTQTVPAAQQPVQAVQPGKAPIVVENPPIYPKATYALVMSLADGSHDRDVLITKKMNQIYLFKYCSATDKDGRPNVIADFRVDRFNQPGTYLKSAPTDHEAGTQAQQYLQTKLATYFADPNLCQTVGQGPYGLVYHIPYSTDTNALPEGIGAALSSLVAVRYAIASHRSYTFMRDANNTLNTLKFIFSKHFPFSRTAAATAALAVAGELGNLSWRSNDEPEILSDVSDASYLRFQDETQNYQPQAVLQIKTSMPHFKKMFTRGLEDAVSGNYLTPL